MTTTNDLIQATRGHLFTGQPEMLNKLSGALDNVTTTFSLQYDLGGLSRGTIIEIDLEQMYVFSVTTSTRTVVDCIRGFNGTTAAAHSSGATVTTSPKFPASRILQALNDDLRDLSAPVNGLYQIKTVDLTYNPAVMGYNLTGVTDILGVAEVRYRTSGPDLAWPKITDYALMRSMPTTDFASGSALVVYEGGQSGQAIRLRYRAPYTSLASLADDVLAISGLQTTAHDLPPLGAAIRLVAGREIRRNFDEAQGEPRRADEVPPQANLQSVQALARLRQQRINAEQSRLIAAFSYEMVGG